MSLEHTRSTGKLLIGLGIAGIIITAPHFFLDTGAARRFGPEMPLGCTGVGIFVSLIGLFMYFSARFSTGYSSLPISRSSLIPKAGLILVVIGVINLALNLLPSTSNSPDANAIIRASPDYPYRLSDKQAMKVTVPAGYSFEATVEGNAEIYAAPCTAKYYLIYYNGGLYEPTKNGTRGDPARVYVSPGDNCWAIQARSGQNVGVDLNFAPRNQERR